MANTRTNQPVSLKVIIVGGSIAGLATAYALQKSGHKVTVLERHDGKLRSNGAVRSPPNMTKLLNSWGLGPQLDKLGQKCKQFVFQEGASGQLIGTLLLHEEFLKDLMADFLFIQHGDLYSMLLQLALHEGVDIKFQTTVTSIDPQELIVTIGDDGDSDVVKTIKGDFIVGADGPGSLVRTFVLGEEIEEIPQRDMTLNFTIPTEAMREDDELRSLTEKSDWLLWLGDHYLLHGSLVNERKEFSVAFCFSYEGDLSRFKDNWGDKWPLSHFELDLQRFEPRVRKILALADVVVPNLYIRRPYLESSVCARARIVLVGEAAHPLLPCGQHNTSLAIEDAQVLGSLFSRIRRLDQVPRILCAYEDLRQSRCNDAIAWEKHSRGMLTLPKGQNQQDRDDRLRHAMAHGEWDHMDEKRFMEIWGDELVLFSYDAAEKVEDWWTKWGALLDRIGDEGVAKAIQVEIQKGAPKLS